MALGTLKGAWGAGQADPASGNRAGSVPCHRSREITFVNESHQVIENTGEVHEIGQNTANSSERSFRRRNSADFGGPRKRITDESHQVIENTGEVSGVGKTEPNSVSGARAALARQTSVAEAQNYR